MSNRQADIAVRATSSPPENLVGRQVSTFNWSVFGSQNYTDKFALPNDMQALITHSLIGATGALSRLPAFVWQDKHLQTK